MGDAEFTNRVCNPVVDPRVRTRSTIFKALKVELFEATPAVGGILMALNLNEEQSAWFFENVTGKADLCSANLRLQDQVNRQISSLFGKLRKSSKRTYTGFGFRKQPT